MILTPFGLAHSVRADGDDYFMSLNGELRETELTFFGAVRDEDRKFVMGATVHVDILFKMESGPRHLGYDLRTNELGRYRTNNLGRTILGMGFDIDLEAVTLTVVKEGYHLVRQEYRSKRNEKRLIEVNFFMAKD